MRTQEAFADNFMSKPAEVNLVPAGEGSREGIVSCQPLVVSESTLSQEAMATVARLYGSLAAADQFIAVAGWNEADRSPAAAIQLALGLASLTAESVLLADVGLSSATSHAFEKKAAGSRHASIHELLECTGSPGFTELITENTTPGSAIRRSNVKNFYFLPAGSASQGASTSFSQPAWAAVKAPLRQFRRVVLHLGPLPNNARATVIASDSDAAVLTLAAGLRRTQEVLELRDMIQAMRVRLAGLVLMNNE